MYASKCWNTSRSPVDLLVKWVRNVLPLQMAFDWFVGGCLDSFPWSICGHHFSGVEHCSFSISTLKPLNHTLFPPQKKRTCKIYLESLKFTLSYLSFFSSNQLKGTVRTEDFDRRFFAAVTCDVTSKEMIFKPLRFCWSSRHSSFLAPSCGFRAPSTTFFPGTLFWVSRELPTEMIQTWFFSVKAIEIRTNNSISILLDLNFTLQMQLRVQKNPWVKFNFLKSVWQKTDREKPPFLVISWLTSDVEDRNGCFSFAMSLDIS